MPSDNAPPADPTNAEEREWINAAVEQWAEKLLDKSRRNLLLNYRDLKKGTFSFKGRLEVVDKLLSAGKLSFEALVQVGEYGSEEEAIRQTTDRLRTIQRKARENREEKGLETLFVGLGLASWPNTHGHQGADGQYPRYRSPVFLLPVEIKSKGKGGTGFEVKLTGEPQLNEVLLFLLDEDYGLRIDRERFLQEHLQEADTGGRWTLDYTALWNSLDVRAARITEFCVEPEAVIGNFSFAKMAMVHDLRNNIDKLSANILTRAMAGLPTAQEELRQPKAECTVAPEDLDTWSVDQELLVLDADSSQRCVIARASRGQNLVVQGPPGTGKSQTIANLIAQTVGDGRRVLFVAEKRAALNAVLKRLAAGVDLRYMILDLHGASVKKTKIFEDLQNAALRVEHNYQVPTNDTVHQDCTKSRDILNGHALRMGQNVSPTGMTMTQLIGSLSQVSPDAQLSFRVRGEALKRLTAECIATLHDALDEGEKFPCLFLGTDPSPWNNARIRDGQHALELLDVCTNLDGAIWPEFKAAFDGITGAEGCADPPDTFEDVETFFTSGRRLRKFTALYTPEVFDESVDLARALAPAKDGMWARFWATVTDSHYRDAKKRAIGLRCVAIQTPDILTELEQIGKASEGRRRFKPTGHLQSEHTDFEECDRAWASVREELTKLGTALSAVTVEGITVTTAEHIFQSLLAERTHPYFLADLPALREKFQTAGLKDFLEKLGDGDAEPGLWSDCLNYVWWVSALENWVASDSALYKFDGRNHDQKVQTFQTADESMVRLTASRIQQLHADRVIAAQNETPAQWSMLKREINKKSRRMALRKLFTETKDVLTRLMPCWVASPLSVSQLLESEGPSFDLIIFDEASQVLPEDSIPSLYRGGQVVVAGDRHQLPPTQFFATDTEAGDEDGDEAGDVAAQVRGATEGLESLLGTLETFLPEAYLEWHYRSEDERLIAFSNKYVYDNRLVTFPGLRLPDAITHQQVKQQGAGGETNSPTVEVIKVADLVFEHLRKRPQESLGIIAMGVTHANRVQAEIDKRVRDSTDEAVECFFSVEKPEAERFFVKNLETVQGDERDAIILTVGYGKNDKGALPLTFGPLTHKAGYRRLNVAVTRAKKRITAVSAFSHSDIDLSKSSARGIELLQRYLEFARKGGVLPEGGPEGAVENVFEGAIKDALKEAGIETWAQYGVSRYRIDLVALHPDPEIKEPVLAIECDGASYHSSPAARDRDRLRQAHLVRMGWSVHRIWSPDWWHNKNEEVKRTKVAFEEAVTKYDERQTEKTPLTEVPGPVAEPEPTTVGRGLRGERPVLAQRADILEYTAADLGALCDWVNSDGRRRSISEIADLMFQELPFARKGAKIKRILERCASKADGRRELTHWKFEWE